MVAAHVGLPPFNNKMATMKKYIYKKINFAISDDDNDLLTQLQSKIQLELNERLSVADILRLALRELAKAKGV